MVVIKERIKLLPEHFLDKVKRNRNLAFKIVEKLVKRPLIFKQFAKEFSSTAKNHITLMKSASTDYSLYLNSIKDVEVIIFSLNVMLKHAGAYHLLIEKEIFTSLKELNSLLSSISPPFNDTILRELSAQYKNQETVQYGLDEPISDKSVNKSLSSVKDDVGNMQYEDTRMESPVNKADHTPTDEKSKRKSRKRSKPST
ncbi:unnamed protein product [Heterobilharzia americana]|nr:unnamed protein product [Heterobilharzia americana]